MATYVDATTFKVLQVSKAATSGETLGSEEMANVSYKANTVVAGGQAIVNVFYGPGQTVAATIPYGAVTYELSSGVVLTNQG